MRHPRVVLALVIGAIALMLSCGLLATGAPCKPTPAHPSNASRLPDLLNGIEPGMPFEFTLTSADLNAFLAGYLETHEHAILIAAVVAVDDNRVTVDLCARDILFRPVSTHIVLDVSANQRQPQITCPTWTVGRMDMPGPLRNALARRLNAEWASIDAFWQIDQWALTEDSLSVAGVRRH